MFIVKSKDGQVLGRIYYNQDCSAYYCSAPWAGNAFGPYTTIGRACAAMIRRGYLVVYAASPAEAP